LRAAADAHAVLALQSRNVVLPLRQLGDVVAASRNLRSFATAKS